MLRGEAMAVFDPWMGAWSTVAGVTHRQLAWWSGFVALGACVAGLTTPEAAFAQTLQFDLSDECPTEAHFWREVAARWEHGDPSTQLGVGSLSTRQEHGEYVGRLELPGSPTREVRGESCAEVLGALALVAVMRLREAAPPESEEVSSPAPGASASPPTPTGSPPPGVGSSPQPAPQVTVERVRYPTPRTDVTPTRSGEASWSVGAGAFVVTGPAPVALAGPTLSLERSGERWALLTAVEAGISREIHQEGGAARFRWWVARAAGCGRIASAGILSLWPCWQLSGGATEAIGVPGEYVLRGWSEPQGWAAGGALLRGRATPGDYWFVEVSGGTEVTLLRHRTEFSTPTQRIHETDILSFSGQLRTGVRLP